MFYINSISRIGGEYMYECWDCGMVFKGRIKDDRVQIFDDDCNRWIYACPNCEGNDFFEASDEDY